MLGSIFLWSCQYGESHVVTVVDDVTITDVDTLGPLLESHERFLKGLMLALDIISRSEINLRVYERGAGETQACGSGAWWCGSGRYSSGVLDESFLFILVRS